MSITAKKLQKPLIVNGQNILPLTSMDQVLTDDEGSRLNETIHQNLAPIELTSTATRAYAVGEFLVYDNLLYRVTSAIALGGTITPGTNCVTDKVGDEIKTIKESLSTLTDRISVSAASNGGSWSGTLPDTRHRILVVGHTGYSNLCGIYFLYQSNIVMPIVPASSVSVTIPSGRLLTVTNNSSGSTGGTLNGVII